MFIYAEVKCRLLVKMWGSGHISQAVIRYRLDNMGKRSVNEKVVIYGSRSFIMGVIQTREYCTLYEISVHLTSLSVGSHNTETWLQL